MLAISHARNGYLRLLDVTKIDVLPEFCYTKPRFMRRLLFVFCILRVPTHKAAVHLALSLI